MIVAHGNPERSEAAPEVLAPRKWRAHLHSGFEKRLQKTVLSGLEHFGPVRVQRAFYPETDGSAHVYLLHPPGGLVVGDTLGITARLDEGTSVLLSLANW